MDRQYPAPLGASVGCVALLAIFAHTFFVSPMNGEDYGLTRLWTHAGAMERAMFVFVKGMGQAINWNARLGEQLAILWLAVPRAAFTAVNVAVFCIYCAGISLLAQGTAEFGKRVLYGALLAAAVIYLCWPRFEIFFWSTAAAEYFQPLVIVLAVVVLFENEALRTRIFSRWSGYAIALGLALCAGFSFETLPPALAVYFALALLRQYLKRRVIDWKLAGVAAACIGGWLALMLAPSTGVRMAYYRGIYHVPASPGAGYWTDRVADTLTVFADSSGILLWLCAGAVIWFCAFRDGKANPESSPLWLGVPALLSVAAVFAAPYTEPRAFVFPWTVMLVFVIRAAIEMGDRYLQSRLRAACMALLTLFALSCAASVDRDYSEFSAMVQARDEAIRAQLGTPACETGVQEMLLRTDFDPRVLNNRETWIEYSLPQLQWYYGCKILLVRAP